MLHAGITKISLLWQKKNWRCWQLRGSRRVAFPTKERPLWYTTKSRSCLLVVNVNFRKSVEGYCQCTHVNVDCQCTMLTMSKYTVNNVSARERGRERERETARERTHFSAGAIKRYIRLTSKRRFSSWGMMRTASHRGKWYILLTNTKSGIFSSHKVVYSPHAPYLCVFASRISSLL